MELTKKQQEQAAPYLGDRRFAHTGGPADRRDMDIPLLPNEKPDQYKNLGKEFPGGDRYPGFTGFLAARMAAYYGYRMTASSIPPRTFDVIELHDAFTISDVQTYEDIGLRPYGHGRDYVESGDCSTPTRTPASRGNCPRTFPAASSAACMRSARAASCRSSR